MKTLPKRFALLLILAAPASPAFSQGLITLLNPGGDRQAGVLNISDGQLRTLGPPVGGEPVSTIGNSDTIDRPNNRLFFVGTPNGDPTQLFIVSTIDGATLASPNLTGFANGVMFQEWDQGESKLFALLSVGPGDRQLSTVNTVTGVVTTLGTPIAGEGLSTGGAHALDPAGNRFFFVGTPNSGSESLYAINTANGAELSSPAISGPVLAVRHLAWDAGESLLFGLFSNGSGEAQLGTINIGTGAVTLRGSPIFAGNFSNFGAALDANANRYYVPGQPNAGVRMIYSLDTGTGLVVGSHAISGPANDIVATNFDPGPLFADGFESGNTVAWSTDFP
jgi:hypothetical protein